MDIKPKPNQKEYILILRRMTPDQRLRKAFDLTEFGLALFKDGSRKAFPELTEDEFHKLYLERLEKCHNRNYRSMSFRPWNR